MKKKALLFDFDGVIVDTLDLALDLCKKVDQPMTLEEYRKLFEGNVYEELKTLIKKEQTQEDDDLWFSLYSPGVLELDPVRGMVSAIKDLSDSYTLVVVSSSVNSPIEGYLDKHDIFKYFDKVFGADVHRSKVEKIKMIFDEFGLSSDECLFITDTLGDMKEAGTMGVESIGVTWGFHPRETLLKGNLVAVVETPVALVSEIDKYFQT